MASAVSFVPAHDRRSISNRILFVAALLYSLPVAALLLWKPYLGIAFAAAPLVAFVVIHGPLAISILLIATFTFFPVGGIITFLPADFAAFGLIAAYLIDLAVAGPGKERNPLARPFVIYLIVSFISIALELFTPLSVRYFLRLGLLFSTLMATAHFGRRVRPEKFLIVFVLAAVANSCYSLYSFFSSQGTIRAFGLAGKGYGDHAMMAFLICAVFYLWSDDLRKRFLWGAASLITLTALAATQTRASVITAGWGLGAAVIGTYFMSRRLRLFHPRKNLMAAFVATLLSLPLLALYTPAFEGVLHRFGRMGFQASETILLRFSLWRAALEAFLQNPVFGIGSGNFAQVWLWVPQVKFDPVFILVSGLGTHAIILGALAETGVVGCLAMANLFYRAVKTAGRRFLTVSDPDDAPEALCLLVLALVIAGSSIYAGAWFWGNNGFHMAVFLGLVASFHTRPGRIEFV